MVTHMRILKGGYFLGELTVFRDFESLPDGLISEKDLCERIGIVRKTAYYWRLQGMPTILFVRVHLQYFYNLETVIQWAIKNHKKIILKEVSENG
jgi:hypothetical protein